MAFALSSGAQLRVPACRSHRRTLAVAPRPLDTGRHVRRVALQQRPSVSTSSVDPMASRTEFEVGFTMPCHSEEQVNSFLNDGSGRLVVIMCKSSHCKPCKAFMATYHQFAERFADSVLLEVTGDENPELRKLMKTWEVKVTPTFRLVRDGKLIEVVTGTGNSKLLKAILANLKDGERGHDYVEATHEELVTTQDD